MDLLDFSATFGTGTPLGVLVHQAHVAPSIAVKIVFVIPAALLYDLMNRVHDGGVQGPSLACAQIGNRMPGMKAGSKEDVLSDRISQSGD